MSNLFPPSPCRTPSQSCRESRSGCCCCLVPSAVRCSARCCCCPCCSCCWRCTSCMDSCCWVVQLLLQLLLPLLLPQLPVRYRIDDHTGCTICPVDLSRCSSLSKWNPRPAPGLYTCTHKQHNHSVDAPNRMWKTFRLGCWGVQLLLLWTMQNLLGAVRLPYCSCEWCCTVPLRVVCSGCLPAANNRLEHEKLNAIWCALACYVTCLHPVLCSLPSVWEVLSNMLIQQTHRQLCWCRTALCALLDALL